MNPEQRLSVIMEGIAIKFFVFFFGTFIWMFGPEWMNLIDWFWRVVFFIFFVILIIEGYFMVSIFVFGSGCLCVCFFFVIVRSVNIYNIRNFFFFRFFCIRIGEINFYRHEGTVFFQNFTGTIFIGKFIAVFI